MHMGLTILLLDKTIKQIVEFEKTTRRITEHTAHKDAQWSVPTWADSTVHPCHGPGIMQLKPGESHPATLGPLSNGVAYRQVCITVHAATSSEWRNCG